MAEPGNRAIRRIVPAVLLAVVSIPSIHPQNPGANAFDVSVNIRHEGNFVVGSEGSCTVTVNNVGITTTGSVFFADVDLPLGFAFVGASGTGWSYFSSVEWAGGRIVSARFEPQIPVGDSVSFTFTVTPTSFTPGRAVFRAGVSGGTTTPPYPYSSKYEANLSNNSATDYVSVFAPQSGAGNRPPIANAGPGLTVASRGGVTLNGTGSRDPDGDALNFTWTELSGPRIDLGETHSSVLSFVAPEVSTPALMVFALSVSDGTLVSESTTTVDVLPCAVNILPVQATHPAAGGTGTLDVITPSPCGWTAVSSAAWLQISSGSSGTGRGTISYRVDPYSGTGLRSAEIRIGSAWAVVQQSGLPSPIFGQVAVGGGYTSSVMVVNVGSVLFEGRLVLTASDGTPLTVTADTGGTAQAGSTFPLSIPPGAVRLLFLTAEQPSAPARSGWARLEGSSSAASGVCTVQASDAGTLIGLAGIPASLPVAAAVLPVDIDDSQRRYTGFAVANPNDEDIVIRVVIRRTDGSQYDAFLTRLLNPLKGRTHAAVFVHQLAPELLAFRGSVALEVQDGRKAAFAGLLLYRGRLSAIPVQPVTTAK